MCSLQGSTKFQLKVGIQNFSLNVAHILSVLILQESSRPSCGTSSCSAKAPSNTVSN